MISFFIVRLKFQKRSELKFVSRTIPQSGGFNTRDYLQKITDNKLYQIA